MKALKIKKVVLLFLLFTGIVNAQIVNIPDANFKARLLAANSSNQIASTGTPNVAGVVTTYNSIDTNGDGQIQVSEAALIKYLDVQGVHITSLIGISSFTSLKSLNCKANQLTSLDVSSNILLTRFDCSDNHLTSLDVSSNLALTYFDCNLNTLTSLNLSSNNALTNLYCNLNHLTSLNVSNNIALTQLDCSSNQLTSLYVSSNTALINLRGYSNQLTSLDVSSNTALMKLDIYSNHLTSLDVSNNTALTLLYCALNQLTSLDVASNTALTDLYCFSNQLTSLDVSSNIALTLLFCDSNQLTTLFIKNGMVEDTLDFSNNPNLTFICADEAQVAGVQTQAGSNVVVSSYCSFVPGGNYNTITGNIKFDANSNGCDATDLPQPNIRVNINDGTNTGANFTNNVGNYSFFTQAGSFNVGLDVENLAWFTVSPVSATIPFANNNNNIATQDFCISANGVHNDLEVVVSPVIPARPGFDAMYKIVYKNKGNQILSGSVYLVFDDAKTDFVAANPVVDNLAVNSLTWNYTDLLPFESRNIYVVLNVNSPLETPAVIIGDSLNFYATITPVVADDIPADNSFSYNQTVVGSFDPNNITCLEGASVSPSTIGDYLHYAINFENTGNYTAENIVVKTTIDPTKFDINSLQLLYTSNPVEARITGNVVEFIFKTIHLTTGGHGHILLKIRSNASLVSGNNVSKRADIFFDYNAPIDTGLVNTVFETLSNSIIILDNSVSVYPNPTKNTININCNSTIKTMELFDVQGRILVTKIVDDSQSNLDISTYSNGVYFVKITTEKGSKVEKIIKE